MKNFLVSVFFCSMLCSCEEQSDPATQPKYWSDISFDPKSTSKFSPRENVECYVVWRFRADPLMSCVFIPREYSQDLE
jgi:hypothetical protein